VSKRCEKCRRILPDGALAYEVRIQVAADFDGVLPDDCDAAELHERLADVLGALERADPVRLMRDVCHVERHLLCPGCRDRYLANPLNLPLPDDPR
jgi:hypothetical protein